jgi:hypothetical protein
MKPALRIDSLPVELALEHLGGLRSSTAIREEMRVMAGGVMLSIAQGGAQYHVTGEIHDLSQDASVETKFIGFLVGAVSRAHPYPLRVPNWLNYGTRGRRRRKTKEPGRVASRGPGTGIKPRGFVKGMSKTRQSERIAHVILVVAKRAGFDATKWDG